MSELQRELFWSELRRSTQARIGLGRTGDALPTQRVLEFRSAHAAARDAVHMPLSVRDMTVGVEEIGLGTATIVRSVAANRAEYLRRPDLGRIPLDISHIESSERDVGFVLADGLSPRAVMEHGIAMLEALVVELGGVYTIAQPIIAIQARVALGDHIAEAMKVRTIVVLIGERPGLSVADSLGIYITHKPALDSSDADRNCISNIHPPEGLGYTQAAEIAAGLIRGAWSLGKSGVALKDTSRTDRISSQGQKAGVGAGVEVNDRADGQIHLVDRFEFGEPSKDRG